MSFTGGHSENMHITGRESQWKTFNTITIVKGKCLQYKKKVWVGSVYSTLTIMWLLWKPQKLHSNLKVK